jgi:signal transduction histidine kinase
MAEGTPQLIPVDAQRIFREYNDERRLALAQGISMAGIVIVAMFILFFNAFDVIIATVGPISVQQWLRFNGSIGQVLFANSFLVIGEIIFVLAWLAARRQEIDWAANGAIIATTITVIGFAVTWGFSVSGFDFVMTADMANLCIPIVVAGVLGNTRVLIATAILMHIVAATLIFGTSAIHPRFEQDMSIDELAAAQRVLVLGFALVAQWGVGAAVLVANLTYARIMRNLSDTRVELERAKTLDDLKDQFIASINHELRNPVMAMQGFLELLDMSEDRATPDQRRDLLQRTISSGDNLAALLDSILDLRRMDRDASDFEPEMVNLRTALGIAVTMIDPREAGSGERDLRVAVPPDLAVWGEHVRVQQIFVNLISNAIKYSPPGSPVEIGARVVAEANGKRGRGVTPSRSMVEISVRDHGLGIPPGQTELLFQRFVRLPRDLASTVVGNGLGLHLCKVLAEAMGGRIWVESDGIEGHGSTFFVRLPMPTAAQVRSGRSSGQLPPAETRDALLRD